MFFSGRSLSHEMNNLNVHFRQIFVFCLCLGLGNLDLHKIDYENVSEIEKFEILFFYE